MRYQLPSLFLSLLVTTVAAAQTTVSVPADRDNTLYEDPFGGLSNGAGQHLFCGTTVQPALRRTLLRFNVAGALPAGSYVLSASLTLNVSRSLFGTPLPVGMHRALADWGEGASVAPGLEGSGGLAMPGDATWLHTFFPGSFWSTPGGDFLPAPSASALMPTLGPATWSSTSLLVADVQSFLDQPATNYGWVLKSDELFPGEVRRFDSRENLTPANRPALSITYLPPGSVQTVGVGCTRSVGGTFQLTSLNAPVGPTTSFTLVEQNGQPGGLAVIYAGLSVLPGPFPLYPGCNFWLNPFAVLVPLGFHFLDGTGSSQQPFPIPAGFTGFMIGFQALSADSGIVPQGYVASNALRVIIG
jgi:hypothetical protein